MPSPPSRAATILVIDDDPDCCELVSTILAGDGRRTVAFTEGRDAVLYALYHPVDVVIVDLHLHGMDGAAVARALRALATPTDPALVAVSGVVEPHWDVVRHFDAYVRKPVDPEMLRPLVASLAAMARARDSTTSRPPPPADGAA
jgi:CheY-like chemotaxis protein